MRSSLASFARLLRRREEVIQFAEDTVDIAPALDEMPFAGQDQTPHARSAFILRDKIKPSRLAQNNIVFSVYEEHRGIRSGLYLKAGNHTYSRDAREIHEARDLRMLCNKKMPKKRAV